MPPGKARALAESQHLTIDPTRLEDLIEYPRMIGGFGTVRVAKLDGIFVVAIKEIRISGAGDDRARFAIVSHILDSRAFSDEIQRFARELKVWAPLNHPNLLKLSGYHIDSHLSIAQFICPFYELGHIGNYIQAKRPNSNSRLKLVSQASFIKSPRYPEGHQVQDTALGLQHLHDHQIVHGDLKEVK